MKRKLINIIGGALVMASLAGCGQVASSEAVDSSVVQESQGEVEHMANMENGGGDENVCH